MVDPFSSADPFSGVLQRWAQLNAWVSAANKVVDTVAAFTARYGAFEDAAEVASFVGTVAAIQGLASVAGGPAALKRELVTNPSALEDATPPASLYDRLIWLANQVFNAAQTAVATLQGLGPLLTVPGQDATARAQALKMVLSGPGGLVTTFNQARAPAAALAEALGAFGAKVKQLSIALAQTKLISQANIRIGALESANRDLAAQQQEQQSASSSSSEDDSPADLAAQIAANTAEIARKQALIDDTAALLAANDHVGEALPPVKAAIEAVALRFQRAANQLIQFCAISDAAQLGSFDWVRKALDLPVMVQGWQDLASAAQSLTQHALIEPSGGSL